MIGPYKKSAIRYLSAIKRLIKERLLIRWKQYWETSDKGRSTARLTPLATRSIRKLHAGRRKEYSALLIQLRTSVIGFNAFLFRRRVPSVLSPRCPCDTGTMTVHYILLSCPTWSTLRMRILGELRTTDMRVLLNTYEGATAAIEFVLRTNLLAQFSLIAGKEKVKRPRDAEESDRNHSQDETELDASQSNS
jgi:hypothetical protein